MPDFDLDAALGGLSQPVKFMALPNSKSAHDYVSALMLGGWHPTLNLDYAQTGELVISLPPAEVRIIIRNTRGRPGFFPRGAKLYA